MLWRSFDLVEIFLFAILDIDDRHLNICLPLCIITYCVKSVCQLCTLFLLISFAVLNLHKRAMWELYAIFSEVQPLKRLCYLTEKLVLKFSSCNYSLAYTTIYVEVSHQIRQIIISIHQNCNFSLQNNLGRSVHLSISPS